MKLRAISIGWLAVTLCGLLLIGFAYQGPLRAIESVDSLKEKQAKIKQVIEKSTGATVAVTDGIGSGSGVIVSEDGLVLTAGHVLLQMGEQDQEFEIIFADGRRVTATPLGKNLDLDSGMLKIDQPGPWPFVPLDDLKGLKAGDWCVALGYPGGYQLGRTPPVRVGRVLANAKTVIMSDSALIGGDSGGPLFNLDGEVIGIHSSIGLSVDQNRHVPISVFQNDWDRLVEGETWGKLGSRIELNPNQPMLGILMEQLEEGTRISEVIEGSPAAKAGLQADDLIVSINGEAMARPIDVITLVSGKQAGDSVKVIVKRDEKNLAFNVTLTRRSELEVPR